MKKENLKKDKAEENGFPGYPHYNDKDDIYKKNKEEIELDPENPQQLKPNTEEELDLVEEIDIDETNLYNSISGDDLDVPGADLDDKMEEIGSEDEENNYYSLGGDNKESEEEDKTQR
ncbi:MAG: hypothetical protein K0S12_1866 [Bacteroidetes bacterium]|jgi:hypothetical protein|nr:hypothetical protein [Bacteroidota bacterium]